MTQTTHADRPVVHTALEDIIQAHGLLPVLRALVARSFRRDSASRTYPLLDNHLRRDIGLPPVVAGNEGPLTHR
jgi:hypothetical protein